jgi:hypothetical protein
MTTQYAIDNTFAVTLPVQNLNAGGYKIEFVKYDGGFRIVSVNGGMISNLNNGEWIEVCELVENHKEVSPAPAKIDNWNIKSFEHATELAAAETQSTGKLHIACDRGESCSPRYYVAPVPAIGEEVSYAFNGDYYPCGVITAISKTLKKITTSEGKVFYRRRQTGSWVMDSTWSLVNGHINRWNPEF